MNLFNLGLLSRALAHFHFLLLLIDKGFSQDVRLPPEITLGPKKEILFRDGDTVRLDCVSNGQPKPWFEWKKDGERINPNDNSIRWVQPEVTGTIEILQATKARTGHYQCLAKSVHGAAMSNVSFVQMAWLDRFPVTGIQLHWRREGEDLVLPCHNVNSVPSATFSWALATSIDDKSPLPFHESDRVRIDEFGNLHFAYVKKEDEYNTKLYKCQIFNEFLDITQGGSYANLSITVVQPIPTSIPKPAFKTESPLIGLVGESVRMSCSFYGNPVSKLTWKKSSGSLPPTPRWGLDPSSYDTEARIDKLEKGDAGDYICTGTSSGGVSSSTITLQIEAKPTFIIGPNHLSSKNATEGDTVTFTCASNATPAANTIWYRNGVILEQNSLPPKYRLSADGLSLTISDLCKTCPDGSSDLTVIQCNASNVHDYVFAQGSINVLVKTKITSPPNEIPWMPNTEIVFPCLATSDDLTPLSRKWTFNNQPLVNDSSIHFDDQGQQLLYIKTANDVNEDQRLLGTYKCIVTNGFSNASVEHGLTVKIEVVSNSVTVYWESEKEFLFPCVTSYDAVSVTYSWFLNNEKLIFNDSVWFSRNDYSLHVETGSDLEEDGKLLGVYRCEVTNGYSGDFVEHQLLSPENGNDGSIWVIIVAIITALLVILAIGAILYVCRRAKKRRDRQCRDKANAGDGATRRSSSSSESEDKYERACVDVIYHEEYTALSKGSDQENGYEIPVK